MNIDSEHHVAPERKQPTSLTRCRLYLYRQAASTSERGILHRQPARRHIANTLALTTKEQECDQQPATRPAHLQVLERVERLRQRSASRYGSTKCLVARYQASATRTYPPATVEYALFQLRSHHTASIARWTGVNKKPNVSRFCAIA